MLEDILINFKVNSDNKGKLAFFEAVKDISFEIKRVYFVYEVHQNTIRGKHAHKKLEQVLWCPYGEISVLLDDGKNSHEIILDSPEKSIIVRPGVWHEMKWNIDNSVLCVAASEYYDESDYIREYKDFMSYIAKGYWSK
ncbi:FdtA/QdtA family cupin domain-containing protein [Fusibacter bizertensis]|uniref:FdtA/QdtA family cupin domain-containing protein n=1 Tax=Fusibacter bizertensis TaxID=1488331 RepID=A0ABT6NE05_9FIRM|nr:FdtA/QdtA family cupin domain-containing protein [Fusibacter bizertensis]MDH8678595.1 FdtA/QdtA family cupin domain-containing protein [Fusibacter bizertensis]